MFLLQSAGLCFLKNEKVYKCGEAKPDSDHTWKIRGVKKHSVCNSCGVDERMEYWARRKEKEAVHKTDRQGSKRQQAQRKETLITPHSFIYCLARVSGCDKISDK
jgi:hypothetical protein